MLKFQKFETCSKKPDHVRIKPLGLTGAIASIALNAFILVYFSPIVLYMDNAHGAEGYSVAATHTVFMINFHCSA